MQDFPPFMVRLRRGIAEPGSPKAMSILAYIFFSGRAAPWKEISNAFARLMHAQGVVSSPAAKSVSLAEAASGGIRTLFIFSMKLSAMRLLEIALLTPWKLHRNSEESSKNGKVRTSLDVDYQPLRVEIS